ncbi:MAG: bifunctional chorismate mutase/prephenate dehydratase [Ruminococcaceae bacterium]|nr:bifunctional chorismate mutase/prephenate dehydratase [Oscillospiraceae bacterium]
MENELLVLRDKIDGIDRELVRLFCERMDVAAKIGEYKKKAGKPVYDGARERAKLESVAELADDGYKNYTKMLYSLLFEVSRSHQDEILNGVTPLFEEISGAVENTPRLFPEAATVACQGTEGAYSQAAAEKLFKVPNIMYTKTFEGVFKAVEDGLCRYGVLPVENSTAGTVEGVNKLLHRHNFHIVRSVRVKVDHNLLVNRGVSLSEITEIVSHEQAINQCSEFLSTLKGVKITPVANTAMAAKMVAESGRQDLAALSSYACAELYSLECLRKSVQNVGNNYTRFICVAKELEIYPGADKTSVMFVTPNKPGALYKVLSRFYALGINLTSIASAMIPERDFEFMFYFDFDTSVYSEEFARLICSIESMCDEFRYLGSYREII